MLEGLGRRLLQAVVKPPAPQPPPPPSEAQQPAAERDRLRVKNPFEAGRMITGEAALPFQRLADSESMAFQSFADNVDGLSPSMQQDVGDAWASIADSNLSEGDKQAAFENLAKVVYQASHSDAGFRHLAANAQQAISALGAFARAEACPAHAADQPQLLADLIANVANPGSVAQGRDESCAAATAERTLAANDPAAYIGLMTQLITHPEQGATTEDGRLTLPGLSPEALDAQRTEGDRRNLASLLFQSSALQAAGVDPSEEAPTLGQMSQVLEHLTGQEGFVGVPDGAGESVLSMASSAARGPVTVVLAGEPTAHAVTLFGQRSAEGGGVEYAILDPRNPSEVQWLPAEELGAQVVAVNLSAEALLEAGVVPVDRSDTEVGTGYGVEGTAGSVGRGASGRTRLSPFPVPPPVG